MQQVLRLSERHLAVKIQVMLSVCKPDELGGGEEQQVQKPGA